MACNHPGKLFWTGNYTKTGKKEYEISMVPGNSDILDVRLCKKRISVNAPMVHMNGHSYLTEYVPFPCGKCIGCRMTKSLNWAVRLACEAKYYPHKTFFVTLTYSDYELSKGRDFKQDYKTFLLNLRGFGSKFKVRYFFSFEYGETTLRPHFHFILFCDLKVDEMIAPNVYHSKQISEAWPFGLHEVSFADFGCMAYVTGYVLKKQQMIDKHHFEVPPFTGCSDKPPLGYRDAAKLNGRDDYLVYGVFGMNKFSSTLPKAFLRNHTEDEWYQEYKNCIIENQELNRYKDLAIYGTLDEDSIGFAKDLNIEKRLQDKEERRSKSI